VVVLRVSICPREVAILAKESTTIWVAGGIGCGLENSALKFGRQELPDMEPREKFLHRISRKIMCGRSTIRGLDTLGATTITDRLEVVDLRNGNYCTTS
jgi:hypothetical protein